MAWNKNGRTTDHKLSFNGSRRTADFEDLPYELVTEICWALAPKTLFDVRLMSHPKRNLVRFSRVSRRVHGMAEPVLYAFVHLSCRSGYSYYLARRFFREPTLASYVRRLFVEGVFEDIFEDGTVTFPNLRELTCDDWTTIAVAPRDLRSFYMLPPRERRGDEDDEDNLTVADRESSWLRLPWHDRFPSLMELAFPIVEERFGLAEQLAPAFVQSVSRLAMFRRPVLAESLDCIDDWDPFDLSLLLSLAPASTTYLDLSRLLFTSLGDPAVLSLNVGANLSALTILRPPNEMPDLRSVQSLRILRLVTTLDLEAEHEDDFWLWDFESCLPDSLERFVIETDDEPCLLPARLFNQSLARLVQRHYRRYRNKPVNRLLVKVTANERFLDLCDPDAGIVDCYNQGYDGY